MTVRTSGVLLRWIDPWKNSNHDQGSLCFWTITWKAWLVKCCENYPRMEFLGIIGNSGYDIKDSDSHEWCFIQIGSTFLHTLDKNWIGNCSQITSKMFTFQFPDLHSLLNTLALKVPKNNIKVSFIICINTKQGCSKMSKTFILDPTGSWEIVKNKV